MSKSREERLVRYASCPKALQTSTCFFIQPLHNTAARIHYKLRERRIKPLLGSKLSADSGAKTRLGPVSS
jgi:hypothetical protein